MTYCAELREFEFTAFTEADLLSAGDYSIGCGDCFTMPATPTTCFTVRDDDSRLSGDYRRNDRADDWYGQRATIEVDGEEVFSNAKIYVEKIWKLRGSDGEIYTLVEIEIPRDGAPGRGDDFFTFKGDVPPAGVELKVVWGANAGQIKYSQLGAGDKAEAEPGAVAGRYFLDADGDARDEGGANGIAGKLVMLLEADGVTPATDIDGNLVEAVLTDADGDYFFGNLAARDYVVVFEGSAAEGRAFVEADVGDDASDSDVNAAGATAAVTVVAGRTTEDVDAGVAERPAPPDGSIECAIDFDGLDPHGDPLAAGDFVSSLEGVSISAIRAQDIGDPGARNAAMIFDTNNPTGGDDDLATSTQNNVLIISEDFDSSDPDDNASGQAFVNGGGLFFFDFDEPVFVQSLSYIEFNFGGEVQALDADGNVLKTVAVADIGDNAVGRIDVDVEGVSRLVVKIQGSGAIDDLVFFKPEPPEPGSLSGRYFLDADRNDQDDDGANGIAGKTVMLFEADGVTPATDINGNTVADVLTDANGEYSFGGLAAGDYVVMFEDSAAEGRAFVDANVGDDATDSDVDPATGKTGPITVVAGANTPDNDAGVEIVDPMTGRIGDTVWLDFFGDGVLNDGALDPFFNGVEAGVPGVTVQLKDAASGVVLAEQLTDADGKYLFTGLAAGDYVVGFVPPAGFGFTAQDAGGDDARDSDADRVTGMTGVVALAAGQSILTVDAGLLRGGLIEGSSQADEDSPVGGYDLLVGIGTDDTIVGRSGEDTLIGAGGDDELYGGSFDDELFGGDGADTLEGGEENDLLVGGAGDDELDGGDERDVAV
ncbi:MAG: SdrD B-like domain-containing protein, partial [Pseudomonadota bacterium]